MRLLEHWQFGGSRQWVCSRARGDVLEVAIGTGLNLLHYPNGVQLTGVDFSPAMLQRARTRADEAGVAVDLWEADAQHLPFDDETFDTAVCTLSLCGIPDNATAVSEMYRVLRPDGKLLLLDHIRSSWPPIWLAQKLIELITVPTAGEYQTRRQLPIVVDAGFDIDEHHRFKAGSVERIAATKPRQSE